MRNIILAIMCLVCAGIGRAEIVGSNLELIPSDVTIGAENTGTLTINLNTDIQTLHDYQLRLTLPVGFTIAIDEDGEYMASVGTACKKHSIVIGKADTDAEHEYNFVVVDMNVTRFIKTGNNTLLFIDIKAPDSWDGETAEGTLTEIMFSAIDTATEKVTGFTTPDYTFAVNKEGSTGITEVSAESLEGAEIFDLTGIRLPKAIPGKVVIAVRNGAAAKVIVRE